LTEDDEQLDKKSQGSSRDNPVDPAMADASRLQKSTSAFKHL
jgi:hypothetical protein